MPTPYAEIEFKKFLNSEDHLKRADFLAWERKYWDLKRMLKYLPKDERSLYNARQILMSNSYGVDNAISKIPDHLKKDPGLEYDRLKWRNRRGRLEGSLEILYKNANKGIRITKKVFLINFVTVATFNVSGLLNCWSYINPAAAT